MFPESRKLITIAAGLTLAILGVCFWVISPEMGALFLAPLALVSVSRGGAPVMTDTGTNLSQGTIGGSQTNAMGAAIAYAPGQVVVVGNSARIVHLEVPAANVQPGAWAVGVGTYDVTKQASLAIADGAWIYWDATNQVATTTPTNNTFLGVCVFAAQATDATVRVFHLPTLPGGRLAIVGEAVAASTAITATAAETAFSTAAATIPANSLAVGDLIRIRGTGICTATNSTDTLTIKVKIGSQVIVATAAVDVANSDLFAFDLTFTVRAIGSSGSIVADGDSFLGTPGTANKVPFLLGATTVDTTAAKTISVTGTWSTNNAGNSCRLDSFQVLKTAAA